MSCPAHPLIQSAHGESAGVKWPDALRDTAATAGTIRGDDER